MKYMLQSRQENRFSVLELQHEVTVNQLNTDDDDKGKRSSYINVFWQRIPSWRKNQDNLWKVKNYADLSTYCIIDEQNIPVSVQSRSFHCRVIALITIGMRLFVVFRQRGGERETWFFEPKESAIEVSCLLAFSQLSKPFLLRLLHLFLGEVEVTSCKRPDVSKRVN